MGKYLDATGLTYFYNQIKSKFALASHTHRAGNITSGTLPIANGGTGATTASDACANIGALPLSGGAMTGNEIKRATNDDLLIVRGGDDYTTGASLAVYGKDFADNRAGAFRLIAHDGTNVVDFYGRPNGDLTWNSKKVELINSGGSNYIRFESGLQICWGIFNVSANGKYAQVTYPVAFYNTPSGISIQDINSTTTWTEPYLNYLVYSRSATGFKISINQTVSSDNGLSYIASGKWK